MRLAQEDGEHAFEMITVFAVTAKKASVDQVVAAEDIGERIDPVDVGGRTRQQRVARAAWPGFLRKDPAEVPVAQP